jgi:hypothetical protein
MLVRMKVSALRASSAAALVWLDRAAAEQFNIVQFLKVHPYFDPLRNDHRFAELERRVGLE